MSNLNFVLRLSHFKKVQKFHHLVKISSVTVHLTRFKEFSTYSNLTSLLESMPKEHKHIAEAQKQRKKIKERFSKYVPGRVTLQVLGSGAEGAPRSLYIFSDQSRYLFNCGEGTQRLAHEHKMKLSKLEHIFITHPVWRNIGGLPGTALTIQDVGVPQIVLHGPQGLEEIFTATKRFVVIKDLKIKMADCSEETTYEDNVMTVTYVPLLRTASSPSSLNDDSGMSTASSIISESIETSDGSLPNKETQAGSFLQVSDASTSTRRGRSRSRTGSRSRSNSRQIDPLEDDIDYYAHETSGSRGSRQTVSEKLRLLLQENKERGVSMAYICRLQPRPGALCLEKCVKVGVPAGPLLGKLKAGEDVTLKSGVQVKSSDVCDPDDPGPVFIVIDCPTEEYLTSLIMSETFKKHQSQATNDNDLANLVVHFTPKNVLNNIVYRQWMDQFSPSTQHIILNEANNCMGSEAVHRIQHKLNLLSEELFPLLGDKGTECENIEIIPSSKRLKIGDSPDSTASLKTPSLEKLSVVSRPTSPTDSFIHANTFCTFHLRPRKGLDRSSELKLTPTQYIEETMSIESFPTVLHKLKEKLSVRASKLSIRPYPKILFLGTGSCIPNKTRNTSGILLQTSENCNILLDCGEGTYGQLVRFFGLEKAYEVLANVNAIYISHLHADHHIGLIGFLQGRRKALEALNLCKIPVLLFAPHQILTWLQFYDKCFEGIYREFDLIPNGDLILNEHRLAETGKVRILNSTGMLDISTVLVKHCPNAFGVAFSHRNGYKITYSGDTMPCESLVSLGMESDLLIHEATMEDELFHEAVIKMHSTTSQAIAIGRKMSAKYTLLTHFSQRYAKLPRFNDNFSDNVGIAFDNMQVRLDELPLVSLLYPALRLMFAEHYEELETKAVKRQLRIERQREASTDRKHQKV